MMCQAPRRSPRGLSNEAATTLSPIHEDARDISSKARVSRLLWQNGSGASGNQSAETSGHSAVVTITPHHGAAMKHQDETRLSAVPLGMSYDNDTPKSTSERDSDDNDSDYGEQDKVQKYSEMAQQVLENKIITLEKQKQELVQLQTKPYKKILQDIESEEREKIRAPDDKTSWVTKSTGEKVLRRPASHQSEINKRERDLKQKLQIVMKSVHDVVKDGDTVMLRALCECANHEFTKTKLNNKIADIDKELGHIEEAQRQKDELVKQKRLQKRKARIDKSLNISPKAKKPRRASTSTTIR